MTTYNLSNNLNDAENSQKLEKVHDFAKLDTAKPGLEPSAFHKSQQNVQEKKKLGCLGTVMNMVNSNLGILHIS
jgi:hypothetical protein